MASKDTSNSGLLPGALSKVKRRARIGGGSITGEPGDSANSNDEEGGWRLPIQPIHQSGASQGPPAGVPSLRLSVAPPAPGAGKLTDKGGSAGGWAKGGRSDSAEASADPTTGKQLPSSALSPSDAKAIVSMTRSESQMLYDTHQYDLTSQTGSHLYMVSHVAAHMVMIEVLNRPRKTRSI